jgi:uncharacterized protein involved in tolerance to divalent cations
MSEMEKLILASIWAIVSFNAVANTEGSKSAVAENAAKLIKAQSESFTKIIKKAISANPRNTTEIVRIPVEALLSQTRSLI